MILKRANGTDITNDLLGLRRDTDGVPKKKPPLRRQGSGRGPKDGKEKDEFGFSSGLEKYLAPTDKEKLKQASTQVTGVTSKRGSQNFFASMLPGGSLASTMDYINSIFFQPGEMACHAHSDNAKRKLASMVTARIDNSDAMGLPSPNLLSRRNGPGSTPGSPPGKVVSPSPAPDAVFPKSIVPFLLRAPAMRNQFRRYVLIDKVNVALGEQPVVAFTFSPVHTVGEDLGLPTLPGQYVELMSQIRQEVVKRPYTIVQGSVSMEFTIYVKIYANGKMSSHLNLERQVKMEISVRGPFDITHRVEFADIIWRRPKDVDPNLALRQDSIMLNPERADGRWRHVYAIVGGTGITPILQLIQYYQYVQKEERKRSAKSAYSAALDSPQDPPIVTWINILFANRTILDVFESGQLESLATDTGNPYLRITISYVFSKPPDNWQGLSGLLDREKVEEWVRICQEQSTNEHQNSVPKPPIQGKKLSVDQLKNRGAIHKSHTIREITQSSSPAGSSARGTGQHRLRPQQERQQRAAQEPEVPTMSVTLGDMEIVSNNSGNPDKIEDISMLPLSRSPTAVGIDEIAGISGDETRQNVVIICGPDKMMGRVKTILTQMDVEEIKENSWVLTLD
ncbi:hypothetical protein BC938DRAFT_471158 [Jimgerdemannia flammicorona]|uniref:FAD-binding FR-type domain-containing protein n=1 Tax=Jimgerdemannia flammicorona TaxID=994334 RepID=A0A433QUS0_9FUNG|nr:hypothetical protein BC938DRAFT_471158 [Jimgerdemannia flammicorona]